MTPPEFLDIADVLRIHRGSIDVYGGDPGIRDIGLLESALAQPMASFGGALLHPGMPEMAAAYLFHIVSNHAFLDGNNRTGALAAFVFLDRNGIDFEGPELEFEELTLAIARGEADKAAAAAFFRTYIPA